MLIVILTWSLSLIPSPLPLPCLQIFSLVVFASIVNEGYVNIGSERLHCVFNKNADACNYGVFVGLVGLLACSFFGLLDFKFSSISSVKDRKKAIMLEIGFSGEQAITSRIARIRFYFIFDMILAASLEPGSARHQFKNKP